MTELLYYEDAYLKTFTAKVVDVDRENGSFILDRTAFYPGGGGQPCDLGTVESNRGTISVVKVKKSGAEVVHFSGGELPEIGEEVTGSLDWERRHHLMRTHSAMHVLCGVMWKDYQCPVTGGNMDPLSARMDFELEELGMEMLPRIEERVNEEIARNHPISSEILDRDEAFKIPDLIRTKINLLPEGIMKVRTIHIEGLDLQADGGTHVAQTAEIGTVRIVKFRSKGKNNKRLYVEID